MSESETPQGPDAGEAAEPQVDPAQLQFALERLRGEQNLSLGIAAGTVAALASAAVWAAITVFTGYQLGIVAIAVGFVVGYAVQFAGKGVDTVFGIAGGVLALVGCLVGNLLAVCGLVARENEIPFLEVIGQLDFALVQDLMIGTFSPIDLLFYAIAVYQGYKVGIREVTAEDVRGGRFSPGGS